jgi:catechol 2,3-dioxygenase-like lactoylglutathione lyase family enzyme
MLAETFCTARKHTMQLAPLICVHDVPASSRWYQRLLGCTSGHGGNEYERLNVGERLILQLHHWKVQHDHGPLGDPLLRPYGNGVILWFELDDFDAAVARASALKVEVLKERRWSENANWEYWLRDPDGYVVALTSPLPKGPPQNTLPSRQT